MATYTDTALALTASLTLLASSAAAQGHGLDRLQSLHLRFDAYGQSRGAEQTERFSKSFRVGPSGTLDLSNLSGDVTVTGGGGDEITIAAVKRVRDRDAGAGKQQLASVSIEAIERAGRVEVRTVYPQGLERGSIRHPQVEVDYTVNVPSGATVYLKTFSGSMKVTSVKGELREDTLSGDLEASDVGKVVRLKTVSGDVNLTTTVPDGEVTLSSVNGTVVVRNVKTRSLDVSTVSGDVRLTDIACDHASLRSISGNVEYTGTLARNGRYEMRSHAGNVRVTPGSTAGFELDAETFSGNARSDLPLTLRAGGGQDEPARRRGLQRQALRGTYGDGSAVLQIRTFSGDITIVKGSSK